MIRFALALLVVVCLWIATVSAMRYAYADDAGPAVTEVADTTPDTTSGVDIEGDPVGSIQKFVEAVRAGNWKLVGSLALALIMLVLSKVRDKITWFSGDRGGAILVMILGLAGGFSAALGADAPIDWKLALGIVGATWTAVGGYTWAKRLIWPKDD